MMCYVQSRTLKQLRCALLHHAGMYGYAGGEGRPFVAASGHHGLIQGEVLLLDEHYSVGADREEGLEDQRKVGCNVLQPVWVVWS